MTAGERPTGLNEVNCSTRVGKSSAVPGVGRAHTSSKRNSGAISVIRHGRVVCSVSGSLIAVPSGANNVTYVHARIYRGAGRGPAVAGPAQGPYPSGADRVGGEGFFPLWIRQRDPGGGRPRRGLYEGRALSHVRRQGGSGAGRRGVGGGHLGGRGMAARPAGRVGGRWGYFGGGRARRGPPAGTCPRAGWV